MPARINLPPVTRITLIVLVLQSLLSAAIRYRQWSAQSEIVIPYLNLIPQLSLIFPWTFVTTTLVENNIFTLTIACLTLYHGGRYLERAWSSGEFAKFLLIVSLIPNLLCFGIMTVLFTLTRDERWTLTAVAGTIPLQASFLVAYSQLIPVHTVTLFRGILSLRMPRLPLLYTSLIALLSLTPLFSSASSFLAIFALLTSWTYLRFFKAVFPDLDSSQPTSLRGDASETFAFAEFFPGPLRPFVATISDQVFDVLVSMRLCVPFSVTDVSAARSDNNFLQRGASGGARAEAERRRALALKALDQRLHAGAAHAAARAQQSSNMPPPQPPKPPAPAALSLTVHTQPDPNAQSPMANRASPTMGESSRHSNLGD